LAAVPGRPEWAALSVLAQFHCRVTLLRKVLRGAFTPVPKVDSALLLMERRERPAVAVRDERLFFRVARAGFGMRRKTLRKALSMAPGLGFGAERLEAALAAAGLDGQRRGETLSLEEWARLADALA
jgi:16S rRNA (adenine1518-N6/adenine1519-N6)-dimethyltransferase